MKTNILFRNSIILISLAATSCYGQKNEPANFMFNLQKTDLIDMMRPQAISTETAANTKEADVIKEFNKLSEQAFNQKAKAIDKLSEGDLSEVNNYMNNKITNPGSDIEEYANENAQAAMNIATLIQEGKPVTKKIIRKEFSFQREFLKKELVSGQLNKELSNLLISLLNKQKNAQELINTMKKADKETSEFIQKHSEIIVNAMFDEMVDIMLQTFQATQDYLKNNK